MPKSKELFKQVVNDIALNEPQGEIESIVYILFEKLLGLSRPDILLNRDVALTNSPELKAAINRINQHEPIQYIVEEAEFYGRKFFVNSNVLIPRPETELLISEIVNRNIARPKILDIGTGSGCIAVSLSLEIPTSQIHGLDISEPALQIARKNNNGLGGTSNFFRADIINDQIPLQQLDFIVSNPPYIADSEKKTLELNVKNFEPSVALFVKDSDPLIFYKAIANQGLQLLKKGGSFFVETHADRAPEVKNIFENLGYQNIMIIIDMFGKERIVSGTHY